MLRTSLVIGAIALLALARSANCLPGVRLTPCEKDDECPLRDGGKMICYNSRCVECHYDADCPEGMICGGQNTCESLSHREKEAEPLPPPASLEECSKRCAKGNDACASACRDQFK
jgi:hypothetical protein